MSAPIIPPRLQRAQPGPTAVQGTPRIPPRPTRKTDPSPDREAYTRSPLNDLPNSSGYKKPPMPSNLTPFDDTPRRPPSIALPSEAGLEGLEYTSYDQLPPEAHGVTDAGNTTTTTTTTTSTTEQTRNVAADVPLHAPKAALPQSTAKRQIETVTRTDSTQAAAAGIGKAKPDDDVHKTPTDSAPSLSRVTSRAYDDHLKRLPSTEPHPLLAKSSFTRSSSSLHNGTPRPPSMHSQDLYDSGIPEIGMQIPLYPNAGDVQAPSPAPLHSQFSPGIGFWNDGTARNHHRKRSSRADFGPSDSYGLHHSNEPSTQFEKDWHMKHPEEGAKEGYNLYAERPEAALSAEELNKIVHHSDDVGMGASGKFVSTPSQDVAFEATDEYTSRFSSPKPSPAPLTEPRKRPSSGRQAAVESPLRKASFQFHETQYLRSEQAVESEDDAVIHCDGPLRRGSKITGGGAVDDTVDLGPTGGNTEELGGWIDERGDGTPILASDEILKRPSSAFMQPAVSPEVGHNFDDDVYDSDHFQHGTSRRSSLQPPSRPSSRPGSTHGVYQGGNLHRFISHEEYHASGMGTPLEEIEEYEPLFPEGEDSEGKPKQKHQKRPDTLQHHHFPSRDVWEDTPTSLQYQTTVQTPEPAPETKAAAESSPAAVFETPEQEQKRREQNPNDMTSDSKTFAKPHFKSDVLNEADRPGLQRFPSRDIWEDTPDSMRLVTTVSGPQMNETKSPPEDRPTTTALPNSQDDDDARASTGMTQVMRPSIPARPDRKSKLAQEIKPEVPERPPQKEDPREKDVPDLGAPRAGRSVPDRPKPSVPARPARFSNSDQSEGAPLEKSTSATSVGTDVSTDTVTSLPAPKSKPAVPARPAGSKIAALQAGFMNDLNKRLQLGPQGPPPKVKEPEPEPEVAEETEKAPLTDARKSRAKGPARRKPAASPSSPVDEQAPSFAAMSTPMTLWQIDENEELNVPSALTESTKAIEAGLEEAMSRNEAKNTEEPTMTSPPPGVVRSDPVEEKPTLSTQPIGHAGDEPAPSIAPATAEMQKAIEPELEASLASAEAAPGSAEELEQKGTADAAVQTGQNDITNTLPSGKTEKMTAYVGGKAPEEGNVIVKDGEEV